ncbi:YciI family protein [Dactylosporangium sp. McL0621]|uniref:YciI family protein n=1 Tax=Dactylosporangium sp. McL0621 TaxID=3415678 RepID=UPI003CF4B78E
MTQYALLLYRSADDTEDRTADLPRWRHLTEKLREAGVLMSNARLADVDTATTVRVRGAQVELTDGPFATTKETLVGVYLLDCDNLDDAVRRAAALPIAEYGSVEVRPLGGPPRTGGESADA